MTILCFVWAVLLNVWDITCYGAVATYYTGNRIFMFIELFMVTFMYLVLGMIHKRYNHIQILVKNTSTTHFCCQVMTRKKFGDIGRHYFRSYRLVDRFNDLFGWIAFLIVANSCLSILAYTTWSHEKKYGSFKGEKILMAIAQTTLILGYNTALVTTCDRIIKTKEKITISCYLQQIETSDRHLAEELSKFALTTERLTPRFLAGGLLEINQNFFSGFLMSVASYCIICIQFNVDK
ncbi:unnamed protein product [Acanthoscelides obtectus]|uniref:Uncharacterized protein n=1 Tax=Acanthoscelides obtectus TaxID=200917 RepID=A0A9P0L7X5_ACAOB|nr:unnamed protein product [Acanthoscelides obtectus]CAK1677742.1 hypothetical protein AOBTE_LOCUS31527 [Acanthoscelides obtectus]